LGYFIAGVFDALDELFGFCAAQPIHIYPLAPKTPGSQNSVREIHVPLGGQVSNLVLAFALPSADDHNTISPDLNGMEHEIHVNPARASCPNDLHGRRVLQS
jgi:hypothetical protein